MKAFKIIAPALVVGLFLSGCGSSKDSSSTAQVLIVKVCKIYNANFSDLKYVNEFSKLAILDPAYIEVARAAGVLKILGPSVVQGWGDSVAQSWVESKGLLDGFCQSVK